MKRPSNDDDQDGPPQKKITTEQLSPSLACHPDRIQGLSTHDSGSAPRAIGFQSGPRSNSRQSSASSSDTPLPLPNPKGKTINRARRSGGAPSRSKTPAVVPVQPQVAGTPTPPTTPTVESTEKLNHILEKIRAIQPASKATPTTGENSSVTANANTGNAPPPPPSLTLSSPVVTGRENAPNPNQNNSSRQSLLVKIPIPFACQTPPGKDLASTSPQISTHEPLPNDTSIPPPPDKTRPLATILPSDVTLQLSPSGDNIQNSMEERLECKPGLIPP